MFNLELFALVVKVRATLRVSGYLCLFLISFVNLL